MLSFIAAIFLCCSLYAQSSLKSNAVHPSWAAQSNIYEVNLRQFSKEGSFKAFAKSLPRLKKMGVEVLWFMPITPIGITNRKMNSKELGSYYAVRDYKGINPEFGTMADFKALVKKAHAMGFKVITDWVANHSSTDNHWIKAHPNFYVKDSTGKILSPYDWSDTYKLNYNDRELRDSMIDAMVFWLKETNIDGFRCDVAGDVPADFWKECIESLKKIRHVFMLAEADNPDLHKAGFDETYAWNIGAAMTNLYAGKINVTQFDSVINHNIDIFPPNAYKLFFTTNHDENSWNGTEFEKYGDAYKTFAVFTQTMYQSVPLIYNGQEVPNKKRLKFFVKDPINWTGYKMAGFYQTLLTLRKTNPALAADGSYIKLNSSNDNAIFSYLREKNGRKLLVILNLSNKEQQFSINNKLINGNPFNVFLMQNEKINESHSFKVEPWGYIVYDYK